MIVIIAGGRKFDDAALFGNVMREIAQAIEITEIVSGASGLTPKDYNRIANGADGMGERYAYRNRIPLRRYYADFKTYGKAAGPQRNARMAQYVQSQGGGALVYFPGGRGTYSMAREARKHGLVVFEAVEVLKTGRAYFGDRLQMTLGDIGKANG